MNASSSSPTVSRQLLLATDLSPRCDRALDRAAQLAGEWGAELLALNVFAPASSPQGALAWIGGDDEQLLRETHRQLARNLRHVEVPLTVRVGRGRDPAALIRQVAVDAGAALVVTGVSRHETLGRFLLGSTVETLARSLPLPLLVVRNRVHDRYRRIVVATDFSTSSRHALATALALFPGCEPTVFHVLALPMAGLTDVPDEAACRRVEQGELADFVRAAGLPPDTRLATVVESGAVEATLARHVRERDVDLVVLGSHGLGGILGILVGSTAARLLEWLPCDTLLVPDPQARPL
ncbi:MAG: hypothetical protein CALGDGBN_00420 [Pseudomonadales bacterium]|nr:hypothetical protein [Pseudomonadales bacterium]